MGHSNSSLDLFRIAFMELSLVSLSSRTLSSFPALGISGSDSFFRSRTGNSQSLGANLCIARLPWTDRPLPTFPPGLCQLCGPSYKPEEVVFWAPSFEREVKAVSLL